MTCERVLEILDAYLDGELDAVNGREVEWHLSECAACRGKLAARRALSQALQNKIAYYRAPETLRRKIGAVAAASETGNAGGRATFWRRTALALAACLVLVIGGGAAWMVVARGKTGGTASAHEQMVAQAVLGDHLRSLQGLAEMPAGTGGVAPGHLMDVAASDQHTVGPWFAGKLPFAPSVRAPQGYELLGGRLDVVVQRPVAALVYRQGTHVINLFTWPAQEKGEAADTFEFRDLGNGYCAVKWVDAAGMEYWAVSDAQRQDLMEFAKRFDAVPG